MDNERWQLIERLFHSALEREGEHRSAFLSEVCATDAPLLAQLDALLKAHDRAGDFIECPPLEAAARALSASEDVPSLNQQIGHYLIVSLLGKGGMGEVYLAEDTKLGRKVALKFLPARFTCNTQHLQRFEREARAASALNHPNILTVHDIGHLGNTHFIATEYIEGETLRQRMTAGKLELKEALDIAIQIAEALSAAIAAGIIHRDIKPENIMIRGDGYVKVLDFGLAKLTERRERFGDGQALNVRTKSGMVMGTINYMSPEQALGREVDHRTDLFSLGVVLYEMVIGTPPFRSDSATAAFDTLLNHAATTITDSDPAIPMELERIIGKALEQDRETRYQTASDLRADLKRLKRDIDSGRLSEPIVQARSKKIVKGGWIAKSIYVAVLLMILAVSSYLGLRPAARSEPEPPDWRNATFTPITNQPGEELFPGLSPDGRSIVYASRAGGDWDIYLQRVGGQTSGNLTEDSTADDTHPAFSPDGEFIAFRSERQGGGIFIMGATGENIRRLTTGFGYNPAWSPDGKEIICAAAKTRDPANRSVIPSKLCAINVATGEERLVTEGDAVQPAWSPHGHRIAYWGLQKGGQRDLWTISAAGGEPVQVTEDDALDWNPVWSPDGKHLYFASDRSGSMNLWRVRIEEESGRVMGQPEAVRIPSSYSQHISFSGDGQRIAYVNVFSKINIRRAVFDPAGETVSGQPVWVTEGARQLDGLDLSPDGQWVVFSSQGETQEDLIIIRSDGTGPPRRLTDDIHRDRGPHFSPDGKQVAFYSDRLGKFEMWMINTDGSGLRQITQSTRQAVYNPAWSPDGTRLAYSNMGGPASILALDKPWAQQTPQVLPSMSNPELRFVPWSWSSDGRKLAGWEARTGEQLGIVLYSLASQRYEKLTDVGTRPTWLSDDRRLLFYYKDKLFLVDSKSKKVREILSTDANEITGLALLRDDRHIYFSLKIAEADIWLMSLE
jgi:Tol biopolymer transport system component/serine/threonine protein kinase